MGKSVQCGARAVSGHVHAYGVGWNPIFSRTSYWKMEMEPTLPAAAAATVDIFIFGASA